MITDAQNTTIRKPASLLVAVAMLLALAAPAQAQDQDLPTVTVSKIADRITEGSSNLVFRIEINPAQSDPLLVHLETEQTGNWVTGTLDGEFNLTIPANRSTLDFGIPPIDDAIVEANGSLTLTVNSGVDYKTGDPNSVTIDVFDNDEPVTLSFADGEEVEVAENAGTVDVSVVVTVDGGKRPGTFEHGGSTFEGQPFSVVSRAGTAASPGDFDVISEMPFLVRGSFSQNGAGDFVAVHTITITIVDDDNQEDTEQFELSLQTAPGSSQVTLPPDPLRIVILDDEEPPPDPCESDTPNDSSTPLSVSLGGTSTSTFCDLEDVDWISLWLTAGQAYRIEISHPHDEYTPRIAGVFDADSQLITGTHSYSGNAYATPRPPGTITFRATVSGVYFLEVKPSRCCIPPRLSPPEEYNVTLTEADAPADDVPDVEEVTLGFNNYGVNVAELDRSIETEGDRDTFLLHARAGHRYHIKMQSHPGPHGFGGIFECIHGIASATAPDQPRRYSRQCAHRPRWTVSTLLIPDADESFLITVGSDDGTGGYSLTIRDQTSRPPNIHDTPLPESDLAADTSTAGRVYINDSWLNGTAVLGEIDLAYDEDWYRVDLLAGQRYQIDIINEPNREEYGLPVTLPDPYMRLYDSQGRRIEGTYDDDGGFSFSALLIYTPTRTGTYYIEVGGNGRQIGTYAVSMMDINDTSTIHRPQEDS